MVRKAFFAVFALVLMASAAHATYLGKFIQTGTGLSTNPIVFPGQFDTYEFQVFSDNTLGPIQALQLDFLSPGGTSWLTTGNTTFKGDGSSANPVIFGFTAPDCFFVLPNGGVASGVGTVDTPAELKSSYFAQVSGNTVTLVPNNSTWTTVAAFSVPTGTSFNPQSVFVPGNEKGSSNGIENPIILVPEPATMTLLGLALVGGFGLARRRRS